MGRADYTDKLMEFGLTRQEASLYYCLLDEGKCSGYEAAKFTGISRSNAYSALASLADKGGARVLEEGHTRKYVAVSPEEFCGNRIRKLAETRDWLQRNAPEKKEAEEGYITIEGQQNIVDKVKNLLASARERAYMVCACDRLPLFERELSRLAGEGKKTVHTGNEVGIDLYLRNRLLHRSYQFIEELGFENQNFLIGTENLLFIFLQFLSNISLCLSKRLLANPVFRHLVLEGIAHL